MKGRSFGVLLLAAFACALLGLILILAPGRQSLTLADLTPDESATPSSSFIFDIYSQALKEGGAALAGADWWVALYVLAALVVLLLVLRMMVSAVRMARSDGFSKPSPPAISSIAGRDEMPTAQVIIASRTSRLLEPADMAANIYESEQSFTRRPRSSAYSFEEVTAHFHSYAHGLSGKMMVTFTGIVAAFGLLAALMVYMSFTASLRKHALERAKITAVNVSDGAPSHLLKNGRDELRETLRKHAMKPGVAYVLVQERGGKLFAHSFPVLPAEVQAFSAAGFSSEPGQRTIRIGNGLVHEVTVPILEGRLGAVRMGVWKDEVDAEIAAAVAPLIKWIAWAVIGGVFAAIVLVWRINQPIIRLVRAAREISHGELDTPGPGIADSTEYGELSRALERMRASVRAAMVRLNGEI